MEHSQLEHEFIEDHRRLTQALTRLQEAVASGTREEIRAAADELDQTAGPHVAFEEQQLYPTVARSRGTEFQYAMEDEHDCVLQSLRELLDLNEGQLTDEDRARLAAMLQSGVDHVVHCGTLLSHLTVLAPDQQQELLERLRDLRRQGVRWTELPGRKRTPIHGDDQAVL